MMIYRIGMTCLCGLIAASLFTGCAALEKACSGKKDNRSKANRADFGEGLKMDQTATYPEISRDSLSDLISSGKVVLVDGNGTESYSERHLPDALDFEASGPNWPDGLPKDRNALIVAYCGGPRCMAWQAPAQALTRLGFVNVMHYPGGISEWEESNLPVERSSEPVSPIPRASGMAGSASIPSCKLSPKEQAARVNELRSDLFQEIASFNENEDALVFQFQDSPTNASAVTEFIRFEKKCCGSLKFTENRESNPGLIQLEIRGPKDVLNSFKQMAQTR